MKPKKKKCKVCPTRFEPVRPMQIACSLKCAIKHAELQQEKKQKAQHKEDKERIKSRGDWLKEAQAAFNSYIRERDHDKPCISCDKPPSDQKHGGQWDAGHYRSVGSAPHMRFNHKNIFKQCVTCNRYLSGNVVEYRKRLIERIGLESVEQVENNNETKKYTIEELRQIKKLYTGEARRLKKERELCL